MYGGKEAEEEKKRVGEKCAEMDRTYESERKGGDIESGEQRQKARQKVGGREEGGRERRGGKRRGHVGLGSAPPPPCRVGSLSFILHTGGRI